MAFNQSFQLFSPSAGEEVDVPYQITGTDSQILQVILRPDEKIQAEPGAMCYRSDNIQEDTTSQGFLAGIQRILTGENMFMNTFTGIGPHNGYVGFTPPIPGKIIPINLAEFDNEVLCQSGAYFVSKNDVNVSLHRNRLRVGFFANEGLFLQRLQGTGLAFITAYGSIIRKELIAGENIIVDAGCLVCMSKSITFDVKYVGSVKKALFGGEGAFQAHLTGPGVVYIQSLPYSRVIARIRSPTGHNGSPNYPAFFITLFATFFFFCVIVAALIVLDPEYEITLFN